MRVKKEYQIICVDCMHSFIAFSPKALRCEECRQEHLRRMKAGKQARYRSLDYAEGKKKVRPMSIAEVIVATLEYNKEHNTRISEGQYVSLMERGLL